MSHGQSVVVVGVDGSERSIPVLQWAAQQARATGAQVRVVTAWRFPEVPGYRAQRVEADLSAVLEHIVAEMVDKTLSDVPHQVVIDEGGAVRLLLREARQADLMVLGLRGHDHDHDRASVPRLGSVTQAVLVESPCPVVVVPVDDPAPS